MKKKIVTIAFIALILTLLTSAATKPVSDVAAAPVMASPSLTVPSDKVKVTR